MTPFIICFCVILFVGGFALFLVKRFTVDWLTGLAAGMLGVMIADVLIGLISSGKFRLLELPAKGLWKLLL